MVTCQVTLKGQTRSARQVTQFWVHCFHTFTVFEHAKKGCFCLVSAGTSLQAKQGGDGHDTHTHTTPSQSCPPRPHKAAAPAPRPHKAAPPVRGLTRLRHRQRRLTRRRHRGRLTRPLCGASLCVSLVRAAAELEAHLCPAPAGLSTPSCSCQQGVE